MMLMLQGKIHPSLYLPTVSIIFRFYSSLLSPSLLYTDNHLLVVNKPAGWHSVPNARPSPKCLLTHLKQEKLGGGSKQDFLLPLHRIDQPCSGVLMFGKTSKAGSRITKLWKSKKVSKFYLVVVSAVKLASLRRESLSLDDGWHALNGIIQPRKSKDERSVNIQPVPLSLPYDSIRKVSIGWRTIHVDGIHSPYSLLLIRTNDGARHMVRAILSQVGKCPIKGDLRYDSTTNILQDQSVALHSYRIHLDSRLQLGSLATFDFEAPIPWSWENYFGIHRDSIK
jgi:23S rRNA pseudouridine1911/1915/1917 synthase